MTLIEGDISKPDLGVSAEDARKLEGKIDHFFHLAAVYDLRAPPAQVSILINWAHGGATLAAYESTIKPIIDKRCMSCHNGGNTNIPGTKTSGRSLRSTPAPPSQPRSAIRTFTSLD